MYEMMNASRVEGTRPRSRILQLISGITIALVISAHSDSAIAQAPSEAPASSMSVLRRVMEYRAFDLGSPMKFDACSISRAMNGVDFRSDLPSLLRPLIAGDESNPCGLPSSGGNSPPCRRDAPVQIDSIAIRDTTAFVRLAVLKGENAHVEDYELHSLRLLPTRPIWSVVEMKASQNVRYALSNGGCR